MTIFDKKYGFIVESLSDITEVTPENIEFLRGIIVNNFYLRNPEDRGQVLRVEDISMSWTKDENFPANTRPFRKVNVYSHVTVLRTKKFKR